MSTITRRMSLMFSLSFLSLSLFACGGSQGGGAEKGPSAYEELSGLSAALQTKLNETMAPINESEAILKEFAELPKTLQLSPSDYKSFIISALQGEMKVPEGAAAEVAGKLTTFGLKFKAFKESIMAAPDRCTELVTQIATTLPKVPLLVTQIETTAKVTKNNPFASSADKAEAAKQSEGAKAMGEETTNKVSEIQKTAQELPGKAQGAVMKFLGALKNVGIDSLDSLTKTSTSMAKETVDGVKSDVKQVVETAKDSAKGAVDAAKDSAKGAADAVKDSAK